MKLCGRGWSPAGLAASTFQADAGWRQLDRVLVAAGWQRYPCLGWRQVQLWLGATVRCFYEWELYDALALRSGAARAPGLALGLGLASFGLGLAFLSQFFIVFGSGTGLLLLPVCLGGCRQGLVGFLLLLGQVVGVVAPI